MTLPEKKTKMPIRRTMIQWFVAVALIPMIIVALAGYFLASDSLTKTATDELRHASRNLSVSIKNWFEYRVMDVNSQAVQSRNVELLERLKLGLLQSGKAPEQYVHTEAWSNELKDQSLELQAIRSQYELSLIHI